MKAFSKLIGEAVEAESPGVEPQNPRDAKDDPKVKVYLQQGYQLKQVVQDDAGNEVAMLVKGDYDDTAYVVLESLGRPVKGFDFDERKSAWESYAKKVDLWLKAIIKAFPQLRISEYKAIPYGHAMRNYPGSKKEDYENILPDSHHWVLSWNSKPFLTVNIDRDPNLEIYTSRGVLKKTLHKMDLQPFLVVATAMGSTAVFDSKKYKKLNGALIKDKTRGKKYKSEEDLRDTIGKGLEALADSEIPPEWR